MKRSSRLALIVLLGTAALAAACGAASPEQQLLNDFFRAARLRDNTTLANMASVGFNPRTDGTVEQFEVVSVGAETRRDVDPAALATSETAPEGDEAFWRRRAAMDRERGQVVNSLTPPGQPDVDVSGMAIVVLSKQVMVSAMVRTPEGQTAPRTLACTFERALGTKDGQTREGRWRITGLEQAAS